MGCGAATNPINTADETLRPILGELFAFRFMQPSVKKAFVMSILPDGLLHESDAMTRQQV